jgi:hypothetical protein
MPHSGLPQTRRPPWINTKSLKVRKHTNNPLLTVVAAASGTQALRPVLRQTEFRRTIIIIIIIRGTTGSDEHWPAEQPPLAVFPDCTRQYWVDMWSAHRIPQLHFQLSKPDRYFFIQVTTQFIRSQG